MTNTTRSAADILVVDDNPQNIELLESLLEESGYSVISARSGSDAIEQAQIHHPKLILMDVVMPTMSGFETCRHLKSVDSTTTIPVIFVTANSNENDEAIGFAAGGVDYITKPINAAVVLARVRTHLELKSYRDSLEAMIAERTEKLNNTTQELAKSNRIKDEFLAIISHELRTPLNGIKGSLYLLEDTGLNQQQNRLLNVARQSTEDLSVRVENILILTEALGGTLKLSPVTLRLRPFIEELVYDIQRLVAFKNIQVRSSIKKDVPDQLFADPQYLKQILGHLLTNAIKFTDEGYVEIRVERSTTLNVDAGQVGVDFTVNDSGVGIANDKRAKIFELFQQGDSAFNRRFGGLGIGLSISRSLVQLMGGRLDMTSRENSGSSFTASLPLALTETKQQLANEQCHYLAAAKKLTVLIVEDNVINQMVEKGIVEKSGHTVFTAANGKEALEILQQQPIDLILMDCQMPVMDGFEATRHIRASSAAYNSIPIIAATANASTVDRERCFNVGMNDYLAKPIDMKSLKEKLLKWSATIVKE